MKLFEHTRDIVGDDAVAETALGTIFMVVRLALNADRFSDVQLAMPEVDVWVKRAMSGSAARTGEMLALINADLVIDRLKNRGVDAEQVYQIAAAVRESLADVLDRDTMDALSLRVPLLSPAKA